MTDEIPGDPPELDANNTEEPEIVATNLGGGWWSVSAPWMEAPEKVQGEAAAKARVAELSSEGDPEEAPAASAGEDTRRAPREYRTTLTAKQKKSQGMPKMTRIVLDENDEIPPTGLYLGHNGRGYMIQPSVEVDVPNFLLEILDNATKTTPVVDPTTKRVIGWRDRPRYSYRRVR